MVCIYKGILLSHKSNEILPFATIWMALEGIISEISHTKTNTMWFQLYAQSKTKPNKWTKENRNTHRYTEQTVARREGSRRTDQIDEGD